MTKICKVDGCQGPHKGLGFCQKHYLRFRHHGDPLGGKAEKNARMQWLLDHVAHEGGDCLFWPFSNDERGYGGMRIKGVNVRANRFLCTMAHGEPPTKEHHAAHSCGNPKCRNQKHVRWATPLENSSDRLMHGTDIRGEKHRRPKLVREQVYIIRSLSEKFTQIELAEQFNVSFATIYSIQARRSWAWLPEEGAL